MNDNAQANPAKLFVGNINFRMTEDALRELFSEYGEVVEVRLITDRATGRAKGFGFVEFANAEDANKAVEALNGHEVEGRKLVVNVARPMQPRNR